MGDFPYIDWLTIEYKKKAEQSGHWTDYLKVFGSETVKLVPSNVNAIYEFSVLLIE